MSSVFLYAIGIILRHRGVMSLTLGINESERVLDTVEAYPNGRGTERVANGERKLTVQDM